MVESVRGTQRMDSGFARLALTAACVVTTCAVLVPQGWAQIGAYGPASGSDLQTTHAPPTDTVHTVDLRQQMRDRAKEALILGDWLIFPSAFFGGIYDTNTTQSPSGARASEGFRLALSGLAERYTDFGKTDLYGMADGRRRNLFAVAGLDLYGARRFHATT